jgi:hypothetical protein
MRSAAAVSLGAKEHTQQQQQGAEGVSLQQLPAQSAADSVLEQVLILLLQLPQQQQGLIPLTAAAAAADSQGGATDDSNAGSSGGCTSLQACFSSSSRREGLLVPVLVWEQHLLWLQLARLLGQQSASGDQCSDVDGGSSSSGGGCGGGDRAAVCRLSILQMLLVQSQGPCLLSMLLLDSIALLLT